MPVRDDTVDAMGYALRDGVRREIVSEMSDRMDRLMLRGTHQAREEIDVTTFSDSTRVVAPSGRVTFVHDGTDQDRGRIAVGRVPEGPTMAEIARAAFGFGEAFRNAADAARAASAALDGLGATLGTMRLPAAPRRQRIRLADPPPSPPKPKVPEVVTARRRHIELDEDDG